MTRISRRDIEAAVKRVAELAGDLPGARGGLLRAAGAVMHLRGNILPPIRGRSVAARVLPGENAVVRTSLDPVAQQCRVPHDDPSTVARILGF